MNTEDTDQRLSQAVTLLNSGETEQARRLFEEIIVDSPRDAEAQFYLGVIHHDQNNPARAVEYFRAYLQERPDVAEVHFNVANLLAKLGRQREAESSFRSTIKLQPDMAEAHNNLGVLYRDNGDSARARKCFEEAIRVQPDFGPAIINLNAILPTLRTRNNSTEIDRRLKQLRPQLADALYLLSTVLERSGKSEQARKVLTEAVELKPESTEWRYHLAATTGITPPVSAPPEYVTALFARYAGQFEEHLRKNLRYRAPEHLRMAVGEIAGDRQLDIIDLGCGTGICGEVFRPIARRLKGIDISPEMAQEALKRGCYDEVCVQNISDSLAGSVSEFDLIVAADVFIYVGDLTETFSLVSTALRDGGLFAFSVESTEHLPADGARTGGYRLNATRRYAHSLDYLQELAGRFRLTEGSVREATLRSQADCDVQGWIVVFIKQPQQLVE